MRTAFLAALARSDTGELRAELRLGGRSVLAWQVDLALALGCERIVCQCEAPGGEVLALQREVEATGAQFHAIRSNLQLASLVRADDDLVMLRDGLVPDRQIALAHFAGAGGPDVPLHKGIATIPADHPLARNHPEDFERIDRDRHWAGLAVMRAAQVHKLADLPPDGAAMSMLLRLALQAGVECRELPRDAFEDAGWMLATDTRAIAARELALIENISRSAPWSGPGRAIAATLVRRIAPRWLDQGSEYSAIAAVVLAAAGAVLAIAGFGVSGIATVALGAFAAGLSEAWARLRAGLWTRKERTGVGFALELCMDAIAAIALLGAYGFGAQPLPHTALVLLAVGLARYLGVAGEGRLAPFWRDRAVQLMILAVAHAFGVLGEALALFALGAWVQLMLRTRAF